MMIRRLKKKKFVLPFATDPKILKSIVSFLIFFFFFTVLLEKICIQAFKTEKYQHKEGGKKKRFKKKI